MTLTDPLHDLRQIPGGDEQTRKVYVAKADEVNKCTERGSNHGPLG